MARFGSLGGLAGFGAERALTSTLGIAGSGVGALLGGGLLAGGALATTAVGMGTDLAGTGQALHGITTTAQAMDKLDVAIATYGKNSRQAVTAQKQLNAAMAEFDPRVRKAYMAAAQTSVAFGDMFHKLTAPAAKTGADIIRQIMLVGEKFLPTIGKFAAENTKIIQKGLQPLFSWLQQAGPQGGLGIFTDLEKIFQKRLPQSIHMLTQAFELFMKVLDAAAQHTGGLIKGLDHFFTKWNSPQNWGQVHHVVESLIHMFDVWLNLFKQIGGALFAVFKPAVGFGTQFIGMLADIIGKIRTWLNLTTTQAALHSLFEAHLAQIKALFGLLNVLLPVLEQTALAFIKVEAAVSQVVAGALRVFVWMINQILRIPLAKTLLGWVFALYLMRSALRSVTVMMGLNSGAGLLGSILGVGRATTATTGLFYGMAGAETTAAGATTGLAATITGTLFPALTALATRFGPMLGLIGAGALGAAMAFTEPSASAKQSIKDLGLKSVGNGVYWSKNTGYVTVSQSGAVTPTTLSGAATHPTRGGGGAPGGPGRGTGDQPAVDRFTMGMLTLPGSIQLAVSRAQGSPNTADDVRANKRAIAYYNNLLRMPGLTSSQKASIIDQINTYKTLNNNAGAGNIPKAGSVPTTGGGGGLGLLPAGMQAALSNAGQRAALAGGSGTAAQQLAANKALLAQQEKALNWLKAQTYTGKQLLAQKREELALAKQIEATQKRIHGGAGSPGSLAIDKILGIGSGKSVAAQLTIAGRERKIMLDFLEHLLGGRKHDIGVTAAALGITRSQLANESLAKLMKQITGTGFRFDSTTLKELRKIHEVLALARKENITLSTAQKDKITSWLQNINNTLKGQSGMGTNYRPVSIESLVNRIPGLSYAQKKLLEANLSQAQAHHFRVPTGGAAAGIALPSGVGPHSNIGAITGLPHPVPTHKHPNVRHPQSYDSGGIHVHGDIVINSSSVNADQLARELRAKLIRNSRRNATQTRGPNAGRSVGLN
jgi:hypothetical protein